MIPTTDTKQNPLEAVVVDCGISGAAKKLGYTYEYIHMVYNGKTPMTDKLRKRIAKLNLKPRVANVIDWPDTPEGRANRDKVKKLSMETRRRVLLEAVDG